MKHFTSVHLLSPPLPPHFCCMKYHKPLEPGNPASVVGSCSHRAFLALPVWPPVPTFPSGRLTAWDKRGQFLSRRLRMEDQSCGIQSFPAFLCDPEPDNHKHWFHSSASVLILKEMGRFEKYHSLCKLEGFCKLNYEV